MEQLNECIKDFVRVDNVGVVIQKDNWYSLTQTETYTTYFDKQPTGTFATEGISDSSANALMLLVMILGFSLLYIFNRPIKKWMQN